jgi:hypothetical protein
MFSLETKCDLAALLLEARTAVEVVAAGCEALGRDVALAGQKTALESMLEFIGQAADSLEALHTKLEPYLRPESNGKLQ